MLALHIPPHSRAFLDLALTLARSSFMQKEVSAKDARLAQRVEDHCWLDRAMRRTWYGAELAAATKILVHYMGQLDTTTKEAGLDLRNISTRR